MNNSINVGLCSLFVTQYNAAKSKGIKFIPKGEVVKQVMLKLYEDFIKEKIMVQIEYLPIEEKMELAKECRETGNEYTNETLMDQCKILSVINVVNKNT